SQIELRLAAHVAGVEALKAAFQRGDDIHAMTASEVFGVPMKKMDAVTRRRAKAINFGIIYGISAFGLGRQIQVPQAEAAAYIKAYFERFPGIRDYMERMKQLCRERGYVETIFGRRCAIPGIKDGNHARRTFAERQAINAPLQGSAADIIKRAMARVPPALTKAGLADLAKEGVKTLINNRPDGEEPVQLSSADARAQAEKLGLQYIYLPVRTDTITAADIDAFARALKSSPKPILAHCRSGTRCYLLWAATQA